MRLRQHVRGQHVHGQHLGVTFGRRTASGFAEDAGVVDDGVHAPELVDLFRERARLRGAGEITDHHARGLRPEIGECRGALLRARVQHHLVSFLDEVSAAPRPSPSVEPVMKTRMRRSFPRAARGTSSEVSGSAAAISRC